MAIDFPSSPTVGQVYTFAGVTYVYSAQGVWATAGASAVGIIGGSPQGRLTLQTATPVMTTTQSAKTTIYYTPYVGNTIPIYDGANFIPKAFTELSVATTDTTNSPAAVGVNEVHDWFVWNDAGTMRLGHGSVWSKTATITVTIANPAVVTWTGHELPDGAPIIFTNSGGALPTGITAGTVYYIRWLTANTFNIATSAANAQANTFIATSGSQSGTHTGENRTTARSTGAALVMVNGILLNNTSITNGPAAARGTYVGTTYSNTSSQLDWIFGIVTTSGGPSFLGVWNTYNRVDVATMVGDGSNSQSFSATVLIPYPSNMKHTFVSGLAEDVFELIYNAIGSASASSFISLSIGYDNIGVKSGNTGYISASYTTSCVASVRTVAIGVHHAWTLATTPGGGTAAVWGNGGGALNIQSGFWLKGKM